MTQNVLGMKAADRAAEWVWERSAAESVQPLLVTNTFQNAIGIESLGEIARVGGQATPQGKQRFEHGPVGHTCRTNAP